MPHPEENTLPDDAPTPSKHILTWYALMRVRALPTAQVAAWLAATRNPPRYLLAPLWTTVGANEDGYFHRGDAEATLAIRRLSRADLRVDRWISREEAEQIWRERRRELGFLAGVHDWALDEDQVGERPAATSDAGAARVLARIVEILDLRSPPDNLRLLSLVEAYKRTHDDYRGEIARLSAELHSMREAAMPNARSLDEVTPEHVRQRILDLARAREDAERQAVAGRSLAQFALSPEGNDVDAWLTDLRRLAERVGAAPVLEDQPAQVAIAEAARLRLNAALTRLGAPATGGGFSFPALAEAFERLVDDLQVARRDVEAVSAELDLARAARVAVTREYARALGMEDDARPTDVVRRAREVAEASLAALAVRDDLGRSLDEAAALLGVPPDRGAVLAAIRRLRDGAADHASAEDALAKRDAEWAAAWDAPGAEPADLAAWVATVQAALDAARTEPRGGVLRGIRTAITGTARAASARLLRYASWWRDPGCRATQLPPRHEHGYKEIVPDVDDC